MKARLSLLAVISLLIGAHTMPLVRARSSPSAKPHKDRIERPRALTFEFGTGEWATFRVSGAAVDGVSLRVGNADYAAPKEVCAKLKDIRFESVAITWNGSFESATKANYFALNFDVGTERERAFGELPHVHILFWDGKFKQATIEKRTAEDTWHEGEL